MAGAKILLVDADLLLLEVVGRFLKARGYEVETARSSYEALRAVHDADTPPSLVITDLQLPTQDGINLTGHLRTHHRTAHIPIILLGERRRPDDAALAYGTEEYVPKPVEMPVLEAKVTALLRQVQAAADRRSGVALGKVIVFLHGKGGVGTTTLAVNLAATLVASGSYPVTMLDLALEFPSVGLLLNTAARSTLADLAGLAIAEIDEGIFGEVVARDGSSVWMVAGSNLPERAGLVTPSVASGTIARLRDRSEYIVVDTAKTFSEINLAALDGADAICVVTSSQVAALKGATECLDVLGKMRVPEERVLVVLNHTTPAGLTRKQVAGMLGREPDLEIPHNERFDEAANAGHPFIITHPHSASAHAIRDLAGRISAILTSIRGDPS